MNKNATNSVKLKELMDEKEETEALLMEDVTDGSICRFGKENSAAVMLIQCR